MKLNKANKVIQDQLGFFNENATLVKPELTAPIFLEYVNAEQNAGFVWLKDSNCILDYGCGTGTTIEAFFKVNSGGENLFVGVDIADEAVKMAKQKYPNFNFYTISNNLIPQLATASIDGACLMHVLHHSHEHEMIFQEIYLKLNSGGQFFIADLSSNNLIVKLLRKLFVFSPRFIKRGFADDLVIDGAIPEKYKVDPGSVVNSLKKVGFSIQEVRYGHLGFFIFAYLDRFIPLSKFVVFRRLYSVLWSLEAKLLKYHFFRMQAEVFFIKCIK